MAKDIRHELVALMEPDDLFKMTSPKKRKEILSFLTTKARLADLTPEEFLKGMSPEKQKAFGDSLLKIQSAPEATEKQTNGDSNH